MTRKKGNSERVCRLDEIESTNSSAASPLRVQLNRRPHDNGASRAIQPELGIVSCHTVSAYSELVQFPSILGGESQIVAAI